MNQRTAAPSFCQDGLATGAMAGMPPAPPAPLTYADDHGYVDGAGYAAGPVEPEMFAYSQAGDCAVAADAQPHQEARAAVEPEVDELWQEKRMAAGLALRVVHQDAALACDNTDPVDDVQQFIVKELVNDLCFEPDDLCVTDCLLKRMYAYAFSTEHGNAAKREYIDSTSTSIKVLHAAYVSQSMMHDAPLGKDYFLGPAGLSRQQWSVFLEGMLRFCDACDFDFFFSDFDQLVSTKALMDASVADVRPVALLKAPRSVVPQTDVPQPCAKRRRSGLRRIVSAFKHIGSSAASAAH